VGSTGMLMLRPSSSAMVFGKAPPAPVGAKTSWAAGGRQPDRQRRAARMATPL